MSILSTGLSDHEIPAAGGGDELDWDIKKLCSFFGGVRPVHAATIYRGIQAGRIPRPFYPTPGIARWSPAECRAARAAALQRRGKGEVA